MIRTQLGLVCGLSLVFCCLSLNNTEFYTEKPSWLSSCRIYEPEFTKCSTNSVQQLIDQLKIGIPEIVEQFGEFDPIHVDDIIFQHAGNEVATISANITEVYIKGFANMKIKENRVSKKDFSWQTRIFMPKLRLDGIYKLLGRLLVVPLNGFGKIFIELDDLEILLYTKRHLYEKGGLTFENVTAVRAALSIKHARTRLDNLFNGRSKELEKSTNQFFNDNWRNLYDALRPIITDTVEKILKDIVAAVFHLIPAKYFIEDIPTPKQLYDKVQIS